MPELPKLDLNKNEYALLEQAPIIVFLLVAEADRKIDKKEIQELINILLAPKKYYCPLLRDVLRRLVTSGSNPPDPSDKEQVKAVIELITSKAEKLIHHHKKQHYASLIKVRELLEDKVPNPCREDFKLTLFHIGHRIACSSGGFLGLGDPVSKAERETLKKIIYLLNIEVTDKLGKARKRFNKARKKWDL